MPPAAGSRHSSAAGRLGYDLSGQETRRGDLSSEPRLLREVRDSLIGFRHYSNSASRMANLGPYWLEPASHPLPGPAVRGLQLERADVIVTAASCVSPASSALFLPRCSSFIFAAFGSHGKDDAQKSTLSGSVESVDSSRWISLKHVELDKQIRGFHSKITFKQYSSYLNQSFSRTFTVL